jgi:hypothetical protein
LVTIIRGLQDNIHERCLEFEQQPLNHTLFLNSVPKSGTHLVRNVIRMFVPPQQHYMREFIQIPNLQRCRDAFGIEKRYVSWGHLLFSDESVLALGDARHIVMVRDPYDWVLARARFYLSEEFQGNLNHLKNGAVPAEELLNMMIVGVHAKAPSLMDIYMFNAAAWIGTRAVLVRYEDMIDAVTDLDSRRADRFFAWLFEQCGLTRPEDWRERVRIGSDRGQSRTARENLTLANSVEIPEVLPKAQRQLVEFHAPGLRELLGYA